MLTYFKVILLFSISILTSCQTIDFKFLNQSELELSNGFQVTDCQENLDLTGYEFSRYRAFAAFLSAVPWTTVFLKDDRTDVENVVFQTHNLLKPSGDRCYQTLEREDGKRFSISEVSNQHRWSTHSNSVERKALERYISRCERSNFSLPYLSFFDFKNQIVVQTSDRVHECDLFAKNATLWLEIKLGSEVFRLTKIDRNFYLSEV